MLRDTARNTRGDTGCDTRRDTVGDTGDFDNAAWPLLIFESGPTPMCFDRFKLRL